MEPLKTINVELFTETRTPFIEHCRLIFSHHEVRQRREENDWDMALHTSQGIGNILKKWKSVLIEQKRQQQPEYAISSRCDKRN